MGKREKDGLFCDEKERKSIILSKSAQREKKKDVHLRRRRSQERRGLKLVLYSPQGYDQRVAARKSGVD